MNYLEKSLEHEPFSCEEAAKLMHAIAEGSFSHEEIAAILISIQQRGPQLNEILGFRQALLELADVPQIETEECIDVCGTGGDGKNTFNISTCTALVLASMGKRVIKHGNYAVSSKCGSSDVLQALGIPLHVDGELLQRQLDQSNICFLHAPHFHPALRKMAPIRKALGLPTVFNVLGPLVNPVQPPFQLCGTYSLELAHLYQHVLSEERQNFHVIHAMDGYDEISLTGDFRILGKHVDKLLSPVDFRLNPIHPDLLSGGSGTKEAAEILRNLLKGKGTPAQNEVVAMNAAIALQTMDSQKSLSSYFEEVLEHLRSGESIHLLHTFS